MCSALFLVGILAAAALAVYYPPVTGLVRQIYQVFFLWMSGPRYTVTEKGYLRYHNGTRWCRMYVPPPKLTGLAVVSVSDPRGWELIELLGPNYDQTVMPADVGLDVLVIHYRKFGILYDRTFSKLDRVVL